MRQKLVERITLAGARLLGRPKRVGWLRLINGSSLPTRVFEEKLVSGIQVLQAEPGTLEDVEANVTCIVVTERRWAMLWASGACFIRHDSGAWTSAERTAGLLVWMAAYRRGVHKRGQLTGIDAAAIQAEADRERDEFLDRAAQRPEWLF